MSKQTAVEWLVNQLNKQGFAQVVTDEEIQQAKEMEKQQIINACDAGFDDGCGFIEDIKYKNAEQYYKETYKP
jgi:predicted GNAT family acetyltransferase